MVYRELPTFFLFGVLSFRGAGLALTMCILFMSYTYMDENHEPELSYRAVFPSTNLAIYTKTVAAYRSVLLCKISQWTKFYFFKSLLEDMFFIDFREGRERD